MSQVESFLAENNLHGYGRNWVMTLTSNHRRVHQCRATRVQCKADITAYPESTRTALDPVLAGTRPHLCRGMSRSTSWHVTRACVNRRNVMQVKYNGTKCDVSYPQKQDNTCSTVLIFLSQKLCFFGEIVDLFSKINLFRSYFPNQTSLIFSFWSRRSSYLKNRKFYIK